MTRSNLASEQPCHLGADRFDAVMQNEEFKVDPTVLARFGFRASDSY
jgi:hypothetical protein